MATNWSETNLEKITPKELYRDWKSSLEEFLIEACADSNQRTSSIANVFWSTLMELWKDAQTRHNKQLEELAQTLHIRAEHPKYKEKMIKIRQILRSTYDCWGKEFKAHETTIAMLKEALANTGQEDDEPLDPENQAIFLQNIRQAPAIFAALLSGDLPILLQFQNPILQADGLKQLKTTNILDGLRGKNSVGYAIFPNLLQMNRDGTSHVIKDSKYLLRSQTAKSEEEIFPRECFCPITQDIMNDPVIATDGHTYERVAIEGWLRTNNTSPITRQPISGNTLIPNRSIQSLIQEIRDNL